MTYADARTVCAHCGKLINTYDQPEFAADASTVALSWHFNTRNTVHPVTYYLCLECHKELQVWLTAGYNRRPRRT